MPRRRPPGAAPGISSLILVFLLSSSIIAVAQQQHSPRNAYKRSPLEASSLEPLSADSGQPTQKRGRRIISENESAIVTVALADNAAVRAPHLRPASGYTTATGLTRPRARSLRDWRVEDFVLLATVDGKIYARERTSGEARWTIGADRPMVETIYHRHNQSSNEPRTLVDDLLWIVEPSQDGSIYLYTPGPKAGIQKLDITVKQLVESTPFVSDDLPVVYATDRKVVLYTIDAGTGDILKMFSASGATGFDQGSCRRIHGLEGADGEECQSSGILTLGQIQYTIGITTMSGRPICTIKYFEWSPNKADRDLQVQYSSTFDDLYIYSKYDGTVVALDQSIKRPNRPYRTVYSTKFPSPVIRVYDVVRPIYSNSLDTQLVILPQPFQGQSEENEESFPDVFVNCTEHGSWFAMSELSYPTVTDGAKKANCYSAEFRGRMIGWDAYFPEKSDFIGVHSISQHHDPIFDVPAIDPPAPDDHSPIEAATEPTKLPESPNETRPSPRESIDPPSISSSGWTWISVFTLMILVLLSVGALSTTKLGRGAPTSLQKWKLPSSLYKPKAVRDDVPSEIEVPAPAESLPEPVATDSPVEDVAERRVRFVEPEGGDSPAESEPQSEESTVLTEVGDGGNDSPATSVEFPEEPQQDDAPQDAQAVPETPKKKKAHRGQRGGRRRRRKSAISEEAETDTVGQIVKGVDLGQDQTIQPDEVTVNGQGITDVSGVKQINNLTIDEDVILGNGSGGTFVFEGRWENKAVAVKRMLPQYFEIASQEVALLQETDDHENVIRYYCQQKDQHFLYIAIELCQASLWDLYHDGRREEDLSEQQLKLVNEINSDVPRALKQLAEGLHHLHSSRIIHRDIKPQNILIAYPKKNKPSLRLVISDFGLCKTLPDNMSTLVGTTANAGTCGWKAPELISKPRESGTSSTGHSQNSATSNDPVIQGVKRAADIFSLGCVFFYVLTNGSHPFDDDEGWMQIRELNIKKNKSDFSKLEFLGDDSVEAVDLISKMVSNRPEDRPTAFEVKQHPFFWAAKKRLDFLCDVSDHWEREPRDPPSEHLSILESFAEEVIALAKMDFLSRLDKKFIDTLGKQRKYTGDRMLDLLRALRNKKNHYEDMPPDVKARVGELPAGYLRYWTTKFPRLLLACYQCVSECGLQEEARFRPYFEGEE